MNHTLLELIKILILGGVLGLAIYGCIFFIKVRCFGGLLLFLISFTSSLVFLILFSVKVAVVLTTMDFYDWIHKIFWWLMN